MQALVQAHCASTCPWDAGSGKALDKNEGGQEQSALEGEVKGSQTHTHIEELGHSRILPCCAVHRKHTYAHAVTAVYELGHSRMLPCCAVHRKHTYARAVVVALCTGSTPTHMLLLLRCAQEAHLRTCCYSCL